MSYTFTRKQTVTISKSEAMKIIRDTLGFDSDTEIVIQGFGEDWVDVPEDWEYNHCPDPSIRPHTVIRVEFRNREMSKGECEDFTPESWAQEGDDFDIVKYRKVH